MNEIFEMTEQNEWFASCILHKHEQGNILYAYESFINDRYSLKADIEKRC